VLVVLQQELLEHLGGGPLRLVGEVERLAVREHAVAHLEDLRIGVGAGERDRDRVERADGGVGDALALEQRSYRREPVALDRRLLELERGGGRAHPHLELALDLAVAAAEEVDHALDSAAVLLARDVADARRRAAVDVVIEAR